MFVVLKKGGNEMKTLPVCPVPMQLPTDGNPSLQAWKKN